MVVLFADRDNDDYGSFRDEGVKAHRDVLFFLLNMAYLLPDLRIFDYDVGYSLAETRTRIMLGQFKDPVYYSVRDGVLCKMPDHPPLQNSLLKLQINSQSSNAPDHGHCLFMI